MLPETNDTNDPKNYRPIACKNNMLKIYMAIIAQIVNEHCVKNNVITLNQAGGKSGSWGYIDQLLINEMITEEVITNRRNLMSIWLDYRKAFDSVPHSWMMESLKLAKVHADLISTINLLTKCWSTMLKLGSENEMIETEIIKYFREIFQGDGLSLLLFILTVNPLSFLLNTTEGYKTGNPGERD